MAKQKPIGLTDTITKSESLEVNIESFIDEQDIIDALTDAYGTAEQNIQKERLANAKAQAEYYFKLEQQGIEMTEAQRFAAWKKHEKKRHIEAVKQTTEDLKKEFKERNKLTEKAQKKAEKEMQFWADINKQAEEAGDSLSKKLKVAAKAFGHELKDSLKDAASKAVSNLANIGDSMSGQINTVMSSFAQYQSIINTRLQGTTKTWSGLEKTFSSTLGTSPFVRTQDLYDNLQNLVDSGVAFNLEQRAFLMTFSDKIAATFNLMDESLRRIVRIQQADSSAARLGMEAYLTRYLNSMYETTEYLTDSFDSVSASLMEASALMSVQEAVEFEYIVQKWLGSLSSVGLSSSTTSSIAEALGWLSSGNIDALSSSTLQNLLVMSANRAGLSYSELLTGGLTAKTTNDLLREMVEYLQEIAQNENKVVKSQLASTFGVSISDLTALANLSTSDLNNISKNMMSYTGAMTELQSQFGQLGSRVSAAGFIDTLFENFQYELAAGLAGNPVSSIMWKITDMIQGVTGGIALPTISVMGSGIDIETTIENLIKTGMVGISALGGIGSIIAGLAGAANPAGLLTKFGISPSSIVTTSRGSGLGSRLAGLSEGITGVITAGSGEDVASQTVNQANKDAEEQMNEQKASMTDKTTNDIYYYLMDMLDPKLVTISKLLGIMTGTTVSTSNFGNLENRGTYEFEYGTQIKIEEAPTSDKTEPLLEIASNVSRIVDVLENGVISIKDSTLSGLGGSL